MHRTTVTFPETLVRKAKLKATAEGVSLSEVLRKLLDRWIRGEIEMESPGPRREIEDRALATFGIWRDRDPDEYLEHSRQGLSERDAELEDARVDS